MRGLLVDGSGADDVQALRTLGRRVADVTQSDRFLRVDSYAGRLEGCRKFCSFVGSNFTSGYLHAVDGGVLVVDGEGQRSDLFSRAVVVRNVDGVSAFGVLIDNRRAANIQRHRNELANANFVRVRERALGSGQRYHSVLRNTFGGADVTIQAERCRSTGNESIGHDCDARAIIVNTNNAERGGSSREHVGCASDLDGGQLRFLLHVDDAQSVGALDDNVEHRIAH